MGRRGFTRVATGLFLAILFALAGNSSSWAMACPNEPMRVGFSANLPDCRAYELVTSENGGRSLAGVSDGAGYETSGELFPTALISADREKVAFMTANGPLGELADPTGFFDVIGAQRLSSGWTITRRFSPGGGRAVAPTAGGISSDHAYTFSMVAQVEGVLPGGTLAAAGETHYLGNPDGSFEPVGVGSVGGSPVTERLAQGRYVSPGGGHVIFSTGALPSGSWRCFGTINEGGACPVNRLADNAPAKGTGAVYDRGADGPTLVVSLLPGDAIPGAGQDAAYQGASRDGATVAFKIGTTLYVRVPDGGDGTTRKVAEANPVFAGLSVNGHYLFYVEGGEMGTIHRFDTTDGSDEAVNPTAQGEVVNVSADGSHVYFISEEEIGGEGASGQPNLFAWTGGATSFIGTVLPSDLEQTSKTGELIGIPNLTNWTDWAVTPETEREQGPGAESSRTTPDGSVLVFESKAKLTIYENAGHTEVYRWDAINGVICVSCSPLKAAAEKDARLQQLNLVRSPIVLNNLSSNGTRVFFETPEALVPEDVDGVNDIYQWHQEEGQPPLKLISSGQSREYVPLLSQPASQPTPNTLFALSPDGSDVVFLSQDELVPGAGSGGLSNLYDARVGGGFPTPQAAAPCAEEACHPAGLPAPALAAANSETTKPSGNVKRPKHRCSKKHKQQKKKSRCSKKKSKKKAARASVDAASAQPAASQQPSALPTPSPTTSGSSGGEAAGPTTSATEFEEFGIKTAKAETTTSVAGMHPDFTTTLVLNHFIRNGGAVAVARAENISVKLPPGLLGNPNAVERCTAGEFLAFGNCPVDSQIGIAKVSLFGFAPESFNYPIFNLEPPHPGTEVARIGFYPLVPVYVDLHVDTAGDYAVTAEVHQGPGAASLISAVTTIWGNPADSSHDKQRLTNLEAARCEGVELGTACEAPGGKGERESGIPLADRKAFMINPSACQGGAVGFAVTSYQLPGQVFEKTAPLKSITDCTGLPFEPVFKADPTSHVAGAPTGLNTTLTFPQHEGPEEKATATMREARVTLPAGMQIAAGAANWIGTCSEQQVGFHKEIDAACPDSSKLGTATVTSPALSVPIEGRLYQRTPSPGHQFGLWLVADALGLHVKLPGELEPDPVTGRLTAVFSDLPQVPVSKIDLNVWGGARAPLENPDHCGTFTTDFSFAPHSQDPAASGSSEMTIDAGCDRGFDPKLKAGVTEPTAGKYSPLIVDLIREDGQQDLRGFELTLPDGELAKIKGVPLCSDAAASAGACPADSKIGHVTAASGPGPEPLWVPQPGKAEPAVYLSGSYQGSPFSVVTVVPAQAGPFDLGNVVVRSGLGLDPDTNRAVVKADPLPQYFEGVGLTYRHLHVVVDRAGFSLNPTDCSQLQSSSNVISTQGTVAHPTSPFQVEGCKQLKFKPKLNLKLKGGTKRAAYPALTAVLKARKGDANIGRTSVALPHSEFLAQEHIGTICTRVQFAADKCPKRSVYGLAKAWTPLLAKPLEGPVYLRSSSHPLPDLVAALGGELEVNLAGRIDSKNGGIRTSFEAIPDAPVTKFVLRMKGGSKSLLTNSTNICRGEHRATVKMGAQNGRVLNSKPKLAAAGCKKKR